MNRHDLDIWNSRAYRTYSDSRQAFGSRMVFEQTSKDHWWAIGAAILGVVVVLLMAGRLS